MATITFTVGEVLTASDCDNWFMPVAADKASDTSRTSTATLAADPDLTVAVAANVTYEFRCYLNWEGDNATTAYGIQWDWAVPSGATLRYKEALNSSTWKDTDVVTATGGGAGVLEGVQMTGTLVVSSTAGSLTLNWAQATSSTTATIVHAQSQLTLRRTS